MSVEPVGEQHDDGEDQRGCADDGGADEDGFGGGFEGVAGSVVFFEEQLGVFEIDIDVVIAFQFGADIGERFDEAEFVDALGVVGDGAVTVDGDGDGAHAEESEGDETEGEDRDGSSCAGV